MNHDEICNVLLKANETVRFVGVLGRNGDLVAGGHNPNVENLLAPDEVKMSLHYAAKRWETRRNMSHRVGNAKYSITEYERVKQISIPLSDTELLLISTDTKTDFKQIFDSVNKTLGKNYSL
ncbi:MAG: hypothetical protein EPO62_02080 [Candidatus Nitrosotenuis sp.]|nr:MAG: hypothetical protein EPO62_02080 [Candidatus Nitrosotenuis sp.]